MSMPELFATIEASRDRTYEDRKFFASLQGVDLEEDEKSTSTWEDIKARAFSGGMGKDAKDILSLSGANAKQAGFGIGEGLGYAKGDESEWWKN